MQPETCTIEAACIRHEGLKPEYLQKLCATKKIPAKKQGKYWHIEIKVLNRVFGGGK